MRAREYERAQRGKTPAMKWIVRYIFPGGALDHLSMLVGNLENYAFEVHDIEALRGHYERTTRIWHDRLSANRKEAELEVGRAKTRLWLAWLASCALTFSHGSIGVFQTLASKRVRGASGLPPTREGLYR